ncbi:hypothetical protein [Salibacterium qingdaonense]|uniref:Uncharacterized protein n=1 Tax=Salibacterium qingdaonense TaxID=266892 RepID=A0A1I4I131_9BACI|nr:hypothetical protein [Salibacterium qingdaonense]SFL48125.1 hypothetical protein SAMN04488054_101148 [Salibacterium qingdaonense]
MVFDALSFIFGVFFTINLWVFHFTYGRLALYVVVNFLIDLLFAYPLNKLFQKIGHYKFKNMNAAAMFIISFSLALVNYGFQKFIEKSDTGSQAPYH